MAPQAALGSSQMGKYLYVVGVNDNAEMRLATLGPRDGELVSIVKGLSEGDRKVVNTERSPPRSL